MKKRAVATITALTLLAMSMSGCVKKGSNVKENGLNVFSCKNTYIENIETNEFTQWYEKQSGVKVNWEIASGDAYQALNLKLASGNLPDIFYGMSFNTTQQKILAQNGTLIDLTKLIDKHAPNIKKMLDEREDWKNAITIDGKIYGIPRINESSISEYSNVVWVYKPWMDKLGVGMPETTEDFYNLLKKVKTTDLNGNGKNDEIPFASRGIRNDAGLLSYIMNAFVYTDTSETGAKYLRTDDNNLTYVPVTDEFRDGLRYINKLYQEGLIERDSLTMDRTRITSLGESETPVLFAAPGLWAPYFTVQGSESNRALDYVAIKPLKGPKGYSNTVHSISVTGNIMIGITSACGDPETAIKWLDGLLDEEVAKRAKGTYEYLTAAKEGDIGLDGEPAEYRYLTVTEQQKTNYKWGTFYMGYNDKNELVKTYYEDKYNGTLSKNRYDAQVLYKPFEHKNSIISVLCDEGQESEYTDLYTTLNDCVDKNIVSFITGEKSLENDWDSYINELKTNGLEKYLEICKKGMRK